MAGKEESVDKNFNQILHEIEVEEGESPEGGEEEVAEKVIEEAPEVKGSGSSIPESDYYPHIAIIEDEGIDKKDLPKDIQAMIATFNRRRTTSERKKAAGSTFLKIRNLSAIIADRIMDWLERDDEGTPKPNSEEVEVEEEEIEVEEGETEEDEEEEIEEDGDKSKDKGMFDGILGGIFDW